MNRAGQLEAPEQSRRIAPWARALLPIGGLLVGLLSMEAALRVVAIVVRPRFTRVDDTLGWYHTPGASGQRNMRTKSQGVELVVVLAYQHDELRSGSASPLVAVVDELRSSGITVLDLYQPFVDALSASHEPLFDEQDIHWIAAGHQVFADLVSPVLAERLGRLHPRSCMSRP